MILSWGAACASGGSDGFLAEEGRVRCQRKGDCVAPSVSIASPTAGSLLAGAVTVAGTAADNVGVSTVEIAVDGGAFAPATGTTSWTFALSTTAYASGSHTLTARATDAAGNRATASVAVTFGGETADGGTDSAAPPTAWPNATNTGVPAGTTLTVVNGNLTIDTANTVIDGKDIRGCVNVTAPGVIIRRSKVSCANFYTVASFGGAYTGAGLLIEDTEIDCQNTSGTAVGDTHVTARRLNIHGCENGFDVDTNFVIEDSYIHDLYDSAEAHTDGIQFAIGANVTVSHNAIFVHGTSAIITNPTTTANAVIQNNLLAGGAYTLYCPRDSSVDVHVLNNHFSRVYYPTGGAYGPWTDCEKVAEVSGNVWDDTGLPLAF
jgi:hypothetical protein